MKLQSILCPTDFSHSSEASLRYASTLAAESGATLHLLHVVDESAMYATGYNGVGYIAEIADEIEHEGELQLEKIRPTVDHVKFESHQVTGPPARTILDYAEKIHADLIVMGSHGRTGLSRLLMGSVAEAVVRSAKVPVLTVKQPLATVDLDSTSEVTNLPQVET